MAFCLGIDHPHDKELFFRSSVQRKQSFYVLFSLLASSHHRNLMCVRWMRTVLSPFTLCVFVPFGCCLPYP